jgi:hypothetical protein
MQRKHAYIQEYIPHTRDDGEEEGKKEKKECDWKVYDPCINTGS